MSCIVPGTTSPGKLFIEYTDATTGYKHRIAWRFITGVDLTNVSLLRTEVVRLKNLMIPCVTSNLLFSLWGITLPNGTTYYTEPFSPVVPGTHAQLASFGFKSMTVRIEGTAHPPSPGVCFGRTNCVVFHQGALSYRAGDKTHDLTLDAAYSAFVTGINASTYLPADMFGQQADMLFVAPVQFNAHAQKVVGT
jgi:hypothetical protein